MKKKFTTTGLYKEGIPMPRIEYRIMIGDKDITKKIDLMDDLIILLKRFTNL